MKITQSRICYTNHFVISFSFTLHQFVHIVNHQDIVRFTQKANVAVILLQKEMDSVISCRRHNTSLLHTNEDITEKTYISMNQMTSLDILLVEMPCEIVKLVCKNKEQYRYT